MVRNLETALLDWSWLTDTSALRVVEISPFGDVIFEHPDGGYSVLSVDSAEFHPYRGSSEERQTLFKPSLIALLESSALHLQADKCYALKPLAIFKEYAPENVYVATTTEYISFMGDFHRQIKDLPDGTTVELRVK